MAVRALEPGHGLPHTLLAAVAVHVHVHLHDLGHEKTHKGNSNSGDRNNTEPDFFKIIFTNLFSYFTHG